MNKIDLGQSIGILANVGVIVGIAFLAVEIRESTKATQAVSVQTAAALDQEHLLLVGGNAELARTWETYLRAPETLTEDQRLQCRYLLAAALRRLENLYLLNEMGAISPEGWESRQPLLNNIAGSPGFSEFLDSTLATNPDPAFLDYVLSLR